MRQLAAILVAVVVMVVGYAAYKAGMFTYRWLVARGVRKLQRRTTTVTISPVVPQFHAGGPVPSSILLGAVSAGQITSQIFAASLSETVESEPLEETWSNEKIEAWRVIDVTVELGDPDGLWLGFPHPDGPTEDVVTSVSHPVGIELHAKCTRPMVGAAWRACDEVPGENCRSGYGDGCGFYAFKTRDDAVTLTRNIFRFSGRISIARVMLWGKIIEHENGYRAEILEVVDVEPSTPQDLSMGIGFAQAARSLATFGVVSGQLWPKAVAAPQNPFTTTAHIIPWGNPSGDGS